MLKCNLRPGDNNFSQLRRNYSHHRRAIRSSPLRNATWALYWNIRNPNDGYELLGRHTEQWDITLLIHDWREDRQLCASEWRSNRENQQITAQANMYNLSFSVLTSGLIHWFRHIRHFLQPQRLVQPWCLYLLSASKASLTSVFKHI